MTTVKCGHCGTTLPGDAKFCLTCGTNMSDPGGGPRTTGSGPELGAHLSRVLGDRYQVKQELGRGGMGAVFLAEDTTLERPVAIKVLPPELSKDESFVGRFSREARTAAKLDHPNIVPIFAVETGYDLKYYVMKYVCGRSLEDVMASGPLPLDVCQRILWEAAVALGHAHQRGVVHRDIKPANLMIDQDGRTMLTDFGISKAMQSSTSLTGTGKIIGTPYYMSPEQTKGSGDVDGRSDQYSLGVVAYEMLTGKLPFEDDSVHTVLFKHVFEPAAPIRSLRPDVLPTLASAVHRALEKEPAKRFPTMEAFAAAVWPDSPKASSSLFITSGSIRTSVDSPTELTDTPARPTKPRAPIRPVVKKKPRGGLVVAASLLVAAGVGGGYWVLARERQSPPISPAPAGGDSTSQAAGSTGNNALVSRDSTSVDTATRVSATPPPPAPPPRNAGRLPRTQAGKPLPAPPPPPPPGPAAPAGGSDPVAPTVGWLVVDAEPYGSVSVNGVDRGDTPQRLELKPGRYSVRITRDGCRTEQFSVEITAGNSERANKKLACEPQ